MLIVTYHIIFKEVTVPEKKVEKVSLAGIVEFELQPTHLSWYFPSGNVRNINKKTSTSKLQ